MMNKEKVKAESREAEKEIDRYERIVERAHSEVQAVRSVYKWFAGLIGIISAVGIGAATFLTYNTLTDMRTDFRGIKSDIQKELAAVQVKLVDRIDDEFKTEKIQSLIEEKAKEYTERASGQFIAGKVNEVITPFRNEMESILQKSDEELQKLTVKNNYLWTVINAQNDDRKAFDQLKTWFGDKTFPLSLQAFNAWTRILDEHNQPPKKKLPPVPWPDAANPSQLSLSDIKDYYHKPSNLYFRPSLIKYIWEREDFSKYDRMEFLAEVLKNDRSLRAVEYAGRYFGKEAGLKVKTLAVSQFLDWWKKNKDNLTK